MSRHHHHHYHHRPRRRSAVGDVVYWSFVGTGWMLAIGLGIELAVLAFAAFLVVVAVLVVTAGVVALVRYVRRAPTPDLTTTGAP